MTEAKTSDKTQTIQAQIVIRKISVTDLKQVLAKGFDDFKTVPSHLMMLVIIYPIICLVLVRMAAGYDLLPLLFPIISGFALIGPLAAIGLYEFSRRRELGLDVSWRHAFGVVRSPAILSVIKLGLIQLIIYLIWLYAAQFIYTNFFGTSVPASITELAQQIFTTSAGWTLLIIGSSVGAIFAGLVLAISAISFPMLLHHDFGAKIAVQTSLRAVGKNPGPMIAWGLIVMVLLGLGSLPLFVGLAVTMPILGHATWHLYRKMVKV